MRKTQKTNKEKYDIITRHTSACFRIQKNDDFAKFVNSERYRGRVEKYESHTYGRFMRKLIKKKTGEVTNIVCQHIEAPNKGYPKGFKNYDTFNPRYKQPRRKRKK